MYLGQEQWAQAQQQHQQRAAGGCAPAAQAAGGSTPEVGNATQITLAGCRDTVVGPVIRGEYTMSSLNHGKPVYRRDAHVNGLQVMIYFWDDRDGEASAGWWIGPKVGSEQVWAHNAATDTKTPPVAGWKVPHTGPVDVTMQLAAKGGSAQAPNGMAFQQPGQQAQQQQQPQHQQPMQQQQHQQMQQQHQQPMQQQHQQMQQQHQQPMQQQQHHQQQQQYSPAQQQQMSYQQHGQQGQQQYQPMQQQQQQHHQQQHGQQGQQQYQPMQQQQQQHHQQQQGMRQGSAQSGWQQAQQHQQQHQQQHPQAQHQQHQQQSQQMHQQHPQQHQQMRQQQQHSQQQQWQQQQQAQQQQQQLRQQQQQQRQQALQQQQQQAQMLAQQRMQEQKQKQQQLAEQLKKKQEQEKAAGAIRKVAVKLKTVTPEKFDEVKEELQQAMTSGLEACGDLKAKVEAECKEGLQIAEKRIQQLQEQKVANMVRKTIQKIRMAKPESYEETKKELDEVLAKDLESCGSMKQAVKDEADKAVAQAEVRMEQAKELKRKQEEQKAENERKRKEAEEKAAQLLKELQEMVDSATSDADAVEKEVESVLEGMPKLSVQDIESSCQQVTEMADAVREKQQNIMEFIKKNTVAMRVTGWQVAKKIPKDGEAAEAEAAPAEELPSLPKLNQQSGLIRAKLEKCVNSLKGSKANGLKAAAAREALQGARSLVEKFDKDSDGLITKIELRSYAKEIQKVALQEAQLVRIMESLSQDAKDTKNIKVKVDDHQKIKVLVGIQKEIARDTKRREEREQKEAKYAASKAKLQTKLDELSTSVGETEKATLEAETKVTGLTVKGKTMTSSDMLEGSKESTEVLAEVKQGAAATTSKIDELSIGADEEALKHWFEIEKAKLKRRTTQVDNRLTKASNALSKFSEDAKRKDAKEVDVLRKKALAMIRYHQVKKECNNDALFEEFDKNGDDKIDQAEFVSFFESCEKEPPKAPAPAEGSDEKMDADEESAAKADDEGKKEEEAEKKPEEKKPEETEKPTKKGRGKGRGKVWKAAKKADKKAEEEVEVDLATIVLTDADLKRVFTSLDDEGEGSLSKEAFFRIIRMLMRVVKETVLTPNMKIKMEGGNMPICRLSVGDVVEVLMGPVKEEEEGLLRMQVKCIKDDQIGWASVRGTQGTVYFEEGGGAYKVVKETLLTDTFDISGDKENIRKVKDTTRKVKPGEIVDVWEWGRKDEERGLTRMKVKARLDGQVGWVTSMGNTGIAYLEPV